MRCITQIEGLSLIIALIALFDIPISAQQQDSIPNINAGTVASDSVVELKEVVIQAANIIRKNDRFIFSHRKTPKESRMMLSNLSGI